MNYLFITTYYWIDVEAFKSTLNRIDIELWTKESKLNCEVLNNT